MANEENLIPFKKVQSGNPKGRPKGAKNRSTIARKWLDVMQKGIDPINQEEKILSQEDYMCLALLKKARQGDVQAAKLLWDSAYGQAKETIDQNIDLNQVDFRELFNFKNKKK